MLRKLTDYRDNAEILAEMAGRAEKDIGTEHRNHYQEDVRWLIAKLIAESETDGFTNLDEIEEPSNLREIASSIKILAAYAQDRATAIELRRKGREEDALEFDINCQALYNKLPKRLQWRDH